MGELFLCLFANNMSIYICIYVETKTHAYVAFCPQLATMYIVDDIVETIFYNIKEFLFLIYQFYV